MKNRREFVICSTAFMILMLLFFSWKCFGPVLARAKVATEGPIINDTYLTAQSVVSGLKAPSAMAFLGPNDIMITEKKTGNVMRIINGVIMQQPLLHVAVTKKDDEHL